VADAVATLVPAKSGGHCGDSVLNGGETGAVLTASLVNEAKRISEVGRKSQRYEPNHQEAVCRDGSVSFSEHRRGTRSHPGGVE
jgi:hypothetical protein